MFTSAYLGATGNRPTVKSHEFIALILEENRRRREKTGDGDSTMYGRARGSDGGKKRRKI
jgi:hypothetical protein